jgi:hypothetical protein
VDKRAVVAIVWLWIAIIELTHLGARSPYSYGWALFNQGSERLLGAVVNPDALPMYSVGLFFYEGIDLDWSEAQNVRLPFHAFATSIASGITRSYLLATYVTNFLFAALVALAAVNLAERFRVRRAVTLTLLLTIFSFPMYGDYLGQPLHYIVGVAVTFLVVLSVVALHPADARNPWIAGLATAILTVNYDPYVVLAALVVYFLFLSRFERPRAYVQYAIAAALPATVWDQFLKRASRGSMSTHLRQSFVRPVIDAWTDFARHPLHNITQPFVAGQIGIDVAIRQVMAMIHWPLLIVCVVLLIRLRPRVTERSFWLLVLMPCALLLEQIGAGAWDWELNPRRAIPVVLTFALAWCAVMQRTWFQFRWRVVFVALAAMSMLLVMSDTLGKLPVMAFLHTGQAVRDAPQEAMSFKNLRLRTDSMPALMSDDPLIWRDLGRARVPEGQRAIFVISQLFNVAMLAAVFWLTARAKLLPRWSPMIVVALWALSAFRFV